MPFNLFAPKPKRGRRALSGEEQLKREQARFIKELRKTDPGTYREFMLKRMGYGTASPRDRGRSEIEDLVLEAGLEALQGDDGDRMLKRLENLERLKIFTGGRSDGDSISSLLAALANSPLASGIVDVVRAQALAQAGFPPSAVGAVPQLTAGSSDGATGRAGDGATIDASPAAPPKAKRPRAPKPSSAAPSPGQPPGVDGADPITPVMARLGELLAREPETAAQVVLEQLRDAAEDDPVAQALYGLVDQLMSKHEQGGMPAVLGLLRFAQFHPTAGPLASRLLTTEGTAWLERFVVELRRLAMAPEGSAE